MDQYERLAADEEKKQFLGNYLYQFINKFCSESTEEIVKTNCESNAGKITGMVLDG